jgi:hypothetical protein
MTLAQNFTTEAEVDAAYGAALAVGATALKAPEKSSGAVIPATTQTRMVMSGKSR